MNHPDSTSEDWLPRARALAAQLAESGAFDDDQRLRLAFETTPRHVFVPCFLDDGPGPRRRVDGADPDTRAEWWEAVYSDTSLTVQTTPIPGGSRDLITSSSTMPGLMARMLRRLDLRGRPGHRVLEIGTATGYNAAILCALAGDQQVTTVELHPDLADRARERLADLDLYPTVVTGDGARGYRERAPFDRILATCATDRIPAAWVQQLAPGGRIVVDLRSEASSSLVVLHRDEAARVSGQLLGRPGNFMWMRPDPSHPLRDLDTIETIVCVDERTTTHPAEIPPEVVDLPGVRVLVGITDPTLALLPLPHRDREGCRTWSLRANDGSWCDLFDASDHRTARQGGPRKLWDLVEAVAASWRQLGSPGPERYGLTVEADGEHTYWLDRPEQPLPPVMAPGSARDSGR